MSSKIDVQISHVVQKYHNQDPLLRLIGPANEATIIVEGQQFLALIDSSTLHAVEIIGTSIEAPHS